MMVNFDIQLNNDLSAYELDDKVIETVEANMRDSIDITALEEAVYRFSELYWNNLWHIDVGDYSKSFHIYYILFLWDEIPSFLRAIIDGQESHLYLEEGPENTCLRAIPKDEGLIEVLLNKGAEGASSSHLVKRANFVLSWVGFAETLFDLIEQAGLLDPTDDLLSQYMNSLRRLVSSL